MGWAGVRGGGTESREDRKEKEWVNGELMKTAVKRLKATFSERNGGCQISHCMRG